jgi:hypothetical protein
VLVDEQMMRQIATMSTVRTTTENLLGRYANYHSTDWQLMKTLLAQQAIENIKVPTTYVTSLQNIPFGVSIVPLRDFKDQIIGYLAVAQSFDEASRHTGRTLVVDAFIGFCCWLLLSLVVTLANQPQGNPERQPIP